MPDSRVWRWFRGGEVRQRQLSAVMAVVLRRPGENVGSAHPRRKVRIPRPRHSHPAVHVTFRRLVRPPDNPVGIGAHPEPGPAKPDGAGTADGTHVVDPVVRPCCGCQRSREGHVEAPREARRHSYHHDDRARDPLPEPHVEEQFAVRPARSPAIPVQVGGGCAGDQSIEVVVDPREAWSSTWGTSPFWPRMRCFRWTTTVWIPSADE